MVLHDATRSRRVFTLNPHAYCSMQGHAEGSTRGSLVAIEIGKVESWISYVWRKVANG
jgi:hypothetical protein